MGDIRGRGLFCGVELVADRESKTPFPPDSKLDGKIKKKAMENRLMVYPNGGTIDGKNGHHILLAPPFIIDPGQVEELVDKLSDTLNAVL